MGWVRAMYFWASWDCIHYLDRALKLRYLLPIVTSETQKQPSLNGTPTSSSPGIRFPTTEPPILFDASAVARKDNGWENMLETVLLGWAAAVVDERRGDR